MYSFLCLFLSLLIKPHLKHGTLGFNIIHFLLEMVSFIVDVQILVQVHFKVLFIFEMLDSRRWSVVAFLWRRSMLLMLLLRIVVNIHVQIYLRVYYFFKHCWLVLLNFCMVSTHFGRPVIWWILYGFHLVCTSFRKWRKRDFATFFRPGRQNRRRLDWVRFLFKIPLFLVLVLIW